jgi:hypothetical protein
MMEMRQNNLVLFIVSPSFFLLEMYPAVLRSNTLFHITKSKNSNRRTFKAFNYKKKAKIYQIGIRKGWGYPSKTKVRDAFFNKYPGGNDFEASYRDKKFKSLRTTTKAEEVIPKFQDQRDKLIALMKFQGLTFKKLEELLLRYGVEVRSRILSDICSKMKPEFEKIDSTLGEGEKLFGKKSKSV